MQEEQNLPEGQEEEDNFEPEPNQPEEGGEGDAPQSVKIGEDEYTPEQLAEIANKAKGYDALLPDYTRKSQELAKYTNNIKGQEKTEPKAGEDDDKAPYDDPDWEPQSYSDLGKAIKLAEERAEKRVLSQLNQKEAQAKQVKEQVDNFVTEVKQKQKGFNEKDFFNFAERYKIPVNSVNDLQSLLSLYNDFSKAGKGTGKSQPVDDKVNKPTGGGGGGTSGDYNHYRTPGVSIMDRAKAAFGK